MNFSFNKLKILSGSMLKLIAIISMAIDHCALILRSDLELLQFTLFSLGGVEFTVYQLMRKIGRLAFPLFCFLIAEGFLHTRDAKKYGCRLLIFAVISEIPFNLMMSGKLFYPSKQNVYFTLLVGMLLLYIFENTRGEVKKAFFACIVAVISVFLKADYGLSGALLIALIHALRKHPAAQAIVSYPLLSGGKAAFAAFLPINMYNGQRGFIQSKALKYGFYLFYPLHILVLLFIRSLL